MALKRDDHPLQSDYAVAASEKILDDVPIERNVGPRTDPLAPTVRRGEEVFTTN